MANRRRNPSQAQALADSGRYEDGALWVHQFGDAGNPFDVREERPLLAPPAGPSPSAAAGWRRWPRRARSISLSLWDHAQSEA
ncbi:MAG: hypothetical protein M1401_20715 [Chloroflexi bacterium]|nr:hypothetical protein [Chloroflexota bacterium]